MSAPAVEEVRAVISTALEDCQILAAITDAQLMVSACVEGLDPDRAAAIVKYVAADLIAGGFGTHGRGVLTSKSLGDASESYAAGGTVGRSAYWQRAIMLDPNGCLAHLGGKRATFETV